MIKVLVSGANGRMGKVISQIISTRDDMEVVAGIDQKEDLSGSFPIYTSFESVTQQVNCVIDFSNPSVLGNLLDYCIKSKLPVILCTTGYNEEQIINIHRAGESIPVFFSMNMSLGINLLIELCKKANKVLGNQFDIEIIEKHHNQKVDAPSGTAYMIADAINEENNCEYDYQLNRSAIREKRSQKEIGIHGVRGGTIVGEHEVLFAGRDEMISITHTALSREIFATGAVNAAKFIYNKQPGMYSMSDLI